MRLVLVPLVPSVLLVPLRRWLPLALECLVLLLLPLRRWLPLALECLALLLLPLHRLLP